MDSRLLGNDIEKELRLPRPGKAGLAMTERGMDSCFRRNDIEECGNDIEKELRLPRHFVPRNDKERLPRRLVLCNDGKRKGDVNLRSGAIQNIFSFIG